MLSRCDFVVIQEEPITIGDTKEDWTKKFRIRGFFRPRQAFLVFNVSSLTHVEVPVKINAQEVGVIYPYHNWEVFEDRWFTQVITIGSGVLRNGGNEIYIKAMPLPDDTDNKYDDFTLKDVICFFR